MMPPASLPAMPAIRPGPMTARKASRPRRPGTGRAGAGTRDAAAGARHAAPAGRPRPRAGPGARHRRGSGSARPPAAAMAAGAARPLASATDEAGRRCRQATGSDVSIASSTVTIPPGGRRHRRPGPPAGCSGRRSRRPISSARTPTATGSGIMTSAIGASGWATIRSRSERTPTRRSSSSMT